MHYFSSIPERMSLRGIAQAIPCGIASTIIPSNDNDHASILGSVFLEAIPMWIASDCSASASQCLATTLPPYSYKFFYMITRYRYFISSFRVPALVILL